MSYQELKAPNIEINRLGIATKEELDKTLNEIIQWLDSVHLAVFTLEQQQDDFDPNLLSIIESAIETMAPIVQTLDMIEEHDEKSGRKIRKIQYEWSSLQHFSNSVKSQLKEVKLQHELGDTLNHLLLRLDDLSVYLFEIQEKRQVIVLKKETLEDESIQDFDARFDVIKSEFDPIIQQMARLKEAGLTRKYEKARERFESLRFDRDELKSDHKEERWLAVFRKVADQVDVMMDGLDKSVHQCSSLVQQFIKTQQQQQQQSTFDKFSKSFFKAFHGPTHSIKAADKEKFRATEKSFEAKYKYYTPSIDRMLAMLGNGIATRASKDQTTIQRHDEMLQRWQQLKHAADTLREHDLIEAARILYPSTTNSNTSSTNSNTSSWKTIRYRTPTPSNENKQYKTSTSSDSHPQLIRSSASDSSSVSSISSGYIRSYRHFNNNNHKRDDFYEQDEREYGVDLVRKRSASVDRQLLQHQQQQQSVSADVITTTNNNRYRSKSSMGNINRAMSPPRQRSFTPSLIPRPKTPSNDSRATSPLSPRPRSAQRDIIPPIPPLFLDSRKEEEKTRSTKKKAKQEYVYKPDKNDPLDVEISHVVNTSPVMIECQRAQPGRYYFGNEASVSSIAGKKLYACKLMTYNDRRNGQFKRSKVLIRVGGGWQDLEFFLLEHSSFMSETSV